MICGKCGSNNITYQRENSFSIGGSSTTYRTRGRRGMLRWFLGLALVPLKIVFKMMKIVATGGLSLFFRKKQKIGNSTTKHFNKNVYKTVAVCQNCGNNWHAK